VISFFDLELQFLLASGRHSLSQAASVRRQPRWLGKIPSIAFPGDSICDFHFLSGFASPPYGNLDFASPLE
jgi:hypothetical protein